MRIKFSFTLEYIHIGFLISRMAKGIDRTRVLCIQVITISLVLFSQRTISVPIYDESLALVALKGGMNDPLLHLADWNVNGSTSPCSWTGVACGNASFVVSLNLSNMNLSGVVSAELANLKHLVNVSLDRNNFTGNLPAEIVTLSQLQYLNVSTNSFSGDLPSNFSQLQLLQVHNYSGPAISPLFYYSSVKCNLL